MNTRPILLYACLTLTIPMNAWTQQAAPTLERQATVRAERYYRTELYLGRSIPGGRMVGVDEWETFLSDVVTPLFPDGFTVLDGRGQYREASGAIAREPSHVLVFLYRKADRKTASASVERIRAEYKKR